MSSGVGETIWASPADIRFKITPVLDLRGNMAGDWDLERRKPFEDTAKYRAIVARYVDGKDWLETELFADAYKRRMEREGRIGRYCSLKALAESYSHRFDKLFASMKRDGFRTEARSGKKLALPAFLIGRDGEVFIGNQGNHRLAMAKVLGLDRIAGRIICNWTP